jgi:hypothetical protein
MKTETPLLKFLRALNTEDRNNLAKEVGSTSIYLYQLAAHPNPNPTLRLAKALCERSVAYSKKMPSVMRVPPLTYEQLLVGAQEITEAVAPPAPKAK